MTKNERGAAMIVSLMAMLLLSALGLALMMTTMTETKIAGNYTASQEAMYAADAAIERAMQDVLTVADWNSMLGGTAKIGVRRRLARATATSAGTTSFNLNDATNLMNCNKTASCSDAEMDTTTEDRPWGANNPRWQLYAYGPVNNFMTTGTLNSTST